MIIEFYYNSSDRNVVDKSLSHAGSYDCSLKDGVSILDPKIIISTANPSKFNYMHIPSFGRYYYITDIMSIRNGIWQISGHVDVLQSYSSEIHSQTGVLARCESIYNLYLSDDKFNITSRRIATTKVFPGGPKESSGKTFAFIAAGSP